MTSAQWEVWRCTSHTVDGRKLTKIRTRVLLMLCFMIQMMLKCKRVQRFLLQSHTLLIIHNSAGNPKTPPPSFVRYGRSGRASGAAGRIPWAKLLHGKSIRNHPQHRSAPLCTAGTADTAALQRSNLFSMLLFPC